MDGLECSEILISEINMDNEKYRLDSDFFQKKFILAYQNIKAIAHSTIRDELSDLTDFHSNGSYKSIAAVFKLLDEPDYAYMVRTTDLEKRDFTNDVKYVSKPTYDFLEKSKVFGGEVIINKIGSPGRTYLMPDLHRPVSLGMNQFMLRMKKTAKIDNALLYVFLNTTIGKLIINRKVNGTVPLTIDKEAIRSIYVPCFTEEFRMLVSCIVKKTDLLFEQADTLYTESQKELMKRFRYNTAAICSKGTTQKNLSESLGTSGRLDAEYYQPKYDELFSVLTELPTKPLGKIVNLTKSIEPGSDHYSDEGIPFVRVSDVSKYEISEPEIKLDSNAISFPEKLYPKKNTILFSKDGSVGIAYKVEEDSAFITSGALLHLHIRNLEDVLPDYLTLVLNSPIVQLQAERDSNGAIIQHWKPSEIENVIVPVLDMDIQKEIAAKVQESFALRKQSKELLEIATQAVEMAIKQGENAALAWMKAKVSHDTINRGNT